jgi:hypothetical protein
MPDPGLTDLIAAHELNHESRDRNFPRSKDPYGIERQAIREALDGGGDGCVAERG